MSHSLFFESPSTSSPVKSIENDNDLAKLKKRPSLTVTSPDDKDKPAAQKRFYLKNMSPNVSKKTIYLNFTPKGDEKKVIKRPTLKRPISNPRSKSSIIARKPTLNLSPSKLSLRRTNSFNDTANTLNNNGSTSDRFIPSRHNSISGKLEINNVKPHPNASPETHIKAQSSKIYQKHVAEACGLEVNSRVLQYQPLPPERKKPINLFDNTRNRNSIRPAIAFARAKKVPTAPDRVLDAPGLIDDFYLNLLAWSSSNLLAIGLEDTVYVWNATTGSVGLLCELPNKTLVTSLKWSEDGSYISIGKDDGFIEIWDIETNSKLRTLNCDNHLTRVASQAWNQHILTSGSRIGNLYHSDVRVPQHFSTKFEDTHLAEICGIEYKSDGQQFSTGGNDNLVCIWDVRSSNNTQQPLFVKNTHKAAVKSLLYCPFQNNLLATGGGSTDKTINFWNTSTGTRVNSIETESQISSLNWGYSSGTGIEIVATHGFPNNNISLFNYPTLQKTGEITQAHGTRILSGCLSPDNLTLATVAGDENLKFWSIFDLPNKHKESIKEDNTDLNDENKRMQKLMNLR